MMRKDIACIVLLVLLSILTVSSAISWISVSGETPSSFLDVEISPRDVKLTVGEIGVFHVSIYNGTGPYDCKWQSDGSGGNYTGFGETIEFSFTEPCNYTILWVTVTDFYGAVGTDSVFVYDPIEIVIEPNSFVTESSYVVFTSGSTTYMRDGSTGEIPWSSTDSSALVAAVIGNATAGETIHFKAGAYDVTSATIVIDKPLIFIGEGISAFSGIDADDNLGTTFYTSNTTSTSFLMNVTGSHVTLENMKFRGPANIGGSSGHGIYWSGGFGSIRDVKIWNFGAGNGLHLAGYKHELNNVRIRNCDIGLYMWKSGSAVYDVYASHVDLFLCGTGAYGRGLQMHTYENWQVHTNNGTGLDLSLAWSDIGPMWFENNNVGGGSNKDDFELSGGVCFTSIHDIVLSGTDTTHGIDIYGGSGDMGQGIAIWNIDGNTGSDVVLRSNIQHIEIGYISAAITNDGLDDYKIFWRNRDYSPEVFGTSWTVFVDGDSNTCMQHSNGTVTWRSTDSDAVFGACVGNSTTGGTIFFKYSEYIVDAVTPLSSNIILDGENAIFTMADGAELWGGIFRVGYDIENVTIRNLQFRGNRAGNPDPAECTLMYIRRANNTLIENCVFDDARVGIHFYTSDTEDKSNNLVIDNNRLTNLETAMAISPNSTGYLESVTISNNYIDTTTIYGIHVYYTDGVRFTNNFMTNTARGMFFYGCKNIVCSDNNFLDANMDAIYYGSIQFQAGCSNGIIQGNTIEYTSNPSQDCHGIVVQADIENVVVSNNVLLGGEGAFSNVSTAIYTHGTGAGANNDVKQVTIIGNNIHGFENGIVVTYSHDCVVSANTMNVTDYGLYPATANNVTWTDNHVISSTGVYGGATDNTFIGNDLTSCTTPVDVSLSGSGNIFQNNRGYNTYSYVVWTDGTYTYTQDNSGVITSGTDSRTVINTFIASVTSGAEILFRSGTYTVSGLYILVAVNNILIEGEGDSTVFVADDALDNQVVYVSGAENVTLRNFKVDGNKAGQTSWGNGILVLSTTNLLIEDVTVEDCYENGISLSTSDVTEIRNGRIEDNNLRGISVSNSNNTSIHHNYINNNGLGDTAQAGIHIGGTSQVLDISHNTVSNTQGNSANVSGIKVFSVVAIDYLPKATIQNNIVHSNVGQGIWLVDSHQVSVKGNIVYNNSYTGIYVEKSDEAIIEGNQVFENSQEGIAIASYGGVRSDFANVHANIITDNGYNGIYAGCYFGLVSGNTFRNNGQSGTQYDQWNGILLLGGNYTIQNNIFIDDQGTVTQKYGINLNSSVADDCTIFSNVMRGLTVALNLESTSDDTWVALNDFRYNTDDVEDQGTSTTWTDNWSISAFHENTAPDD